MFHHILATDPLHLAGLLDAHHPLEGHLVGLLHLEGRPVGPLRLEGHLVDLLHPEGHLVDLLPQDTQNEHEDTEMLSY